MLIDFRSEDTGPMVITVNLNSGSLISKENRSHWVLVFSIDVGDFSSLGICELSFEVSRQCVKASTSS